MINVRETFLKLTMRRYPHGTEDLAMNIVKEILPTVEFTKDEFGNYFTNILKENGEFSDTMFSSHLDTIDSGPYRSDKIWDVTTKSMIPNPEYTAEKHNDKTINHVMDGDFVKTDGTTNLGADDKAGTTIMMNLISENIPGLYYFFVGEETGCIGSSALSRVFTTKDFQDISRCIAFDRRGYDSVITHQSGNCASDTFANELSKRLNDYGFWYKPDPTGIYTDSAEFVDIIQECTNLSVGYFSEHTKTERQDLEFLELLSIVSCKIDWDTLPSVREKTKIYTGKKSKPKYATYTSNRYSNNNFENEWYGNDGGGYEYPKKKEEVDTKIGTKPRTPKTYVDKGNGILNALDDFEFDDWYEKQKLNNWSK